MRYTVAALLLAMTLAGCALDQGQPPAPPAASPSAPAAPADEPAVSEPTQGVASVTGELGGDAQLEGGCVWLETDQGRIEPQWPDGYTVTTDPVALVDPEGETIAEEGDSLTITGGPAPDVATICQVGEVWQVSEVTPAGES